MNGSYRKSLALVAVVLLCVISTVSCQHMKAGSSSSPKRDINAVLADHENELMAIPGVVGIYVGLMSDQKTPCLKVMLARKDKIAQARIPGQLEGYPVLTEVTGEIRPMKK